MPAVINMTVKDLALQVRHTMELQWYRADLRGACVDASEALIEQLKKSGYKAVLMGGYVKEDATNPLRKHNIPHHWVEFDGLVIDLTATQFGFAEKVFVFGTEAKEAIGYVTLYEYNNRKFPFGTLINRS